MAVNKIRVARDTGVDNPDVLLIKNVPEYVDVLALAAGVNKAYTVPAGATVLLFSSTVPFYAKANGTAVIPTVDVTNGTASDYNPTGYYVIKLDGTGTGTAVTTIGFISASAGFLTVVVHKQ